MFPKVQRALVFPLLFVATMLGPVQPAAAAGIPSAHPVTQLDSPRASSGALKLPTVHPTTQLVTPRASRVPLACIACPAPPAPTLTTAWFTLDDAGDTRMVIDGSNFIPGDTIQIDVLGSVFEPIVFGAELTAASGGPCRTSNDCPEGAGAFVLTRDLTAVNCGETLDVAATDLSEVERLNAPVALAAQTTISLDCTTGVF